MWVDSETAIDYLNFSSVAESVVELIEQAKGRPLSIGISGAWGVGKSSLMLLTRDALEAREKQAALESGVVEKEFQSKYIFVRFDAWLYQGYDDARAALMDSIASQLLAAAEDNEAATEKAKAFLARVNWFRVARLTVGSAVAMSLGIPPVGLFGEGAALVKGAVKDGVDREAIEAAEGVADEAAEAAAGLVRPKTDAAITPRQQIDKLRDSFKEALAALDMTLVVLIDDLDRCLPDTAVSTLEAIRLFLFLEGTAFVIAADDEMIRHAVKKHFDNPTDDQVTNYFDKLIQIPVRVPTLGTQEVRAYMFMLHVEACNLPDDDKNIVREAIGLRLQESWKGLRVDAALVEELGVALPPGLLGKLQEAERLTPLMTKAQRISGNPRLIKRFMNSLAIRMALARRQKITVDEEVLAKLLLFERLASSALYSELAAEINDGIDGKPAFLHDLERKARGKLNEGEEVSVPAAWAEVFPQEWLRLDPELHDVDMRGAMYVSREHLPVISSGVTLSPKSAELLAALVEHPAQAETLADELATVPAHELESMFDHFLDKARREQEWGVNPLLSPLLVLSASQPSLQNKLSGFFAGLPGNQIKAALIVKIRPQGWAAALFARWSDDDDVDISVKNAIAARTRKGA